MSREALLGALLSDARRVVEGLLRHPPVDEAMLRAELAQATHTRCTDPASQADFALGQAIALRCAILLDGFDALDLDGQKLVQVAVRYFVHEDDGAADLESAFGFDDDREVVDAVCQALGVPPVDDP